MSEVIQHLLVKSQLLKNVQFKTIDTFSPPCSCFQVAFVQRSTNEEVTASINIHQNHT